ncbi:MAG: PAS domain S-box-containing protein, partial [Candidatus Azotimanducaceae bacterium]
MGQSIERIAVTHLAWIAGLCIRHDIRPEKILGDTPLGSMTSLSWSRYAEILATAGKYFSPNELMTADAFSDLDVLGFSALHSPSAFKIEDHYLSLFGPEGLIQARFPIQSQRMDGGKKHLVLQFSMQPGFDRCPVLFYLIAAQMKQIARRLEQPSANLQMTESAQYTVIRISYANDSSLGAGLKRFWQKLSASNSGHSSLRRILVERERADQALQQVQYDLLETQNLARRNMRSFEQLGQLVQDTSWMMRGELIESVSPSVAELLGYSEAEFIRLRLKDLVAESHQSLVSGMLDQLNEDGSQTTHQTIALNHKHMGEIWISLHATTIRNLDGQSMTWFIASDTNERERFQHQISEKENNFQSITDSALDAIITYDNECRIVYANPSASKVFGYPHQELMSLNIKMLLPESLGGKTIRTVYRAESPASLSGLSLTGLHQARKLIPLEVSFAGHMESGELLTTCIIRDITNRTEQETEKLALEAQVQAAQKMEAIGQLTGGIAHDFNNLLVAIMGFTELAERDSDPAALSRHLSEIRKAGERGRNMTQQLLTFSRKKTPVRKLIGLDATLLDIRDFIARLLPSNI